MTAELTRLPSRISEGARVYLGAVIFFGIMAVAFSLYQLYVQPLGYQWYMLAALTLVSGSATVQLPSIPASISVSETFVIASVLLFGPAAGTVMVALDGLVISFWMAKRRPEWYRALFNMAAPAVSIWAASHLLFAVANIEPISHQPVSVNALLIPLVVFALVYFGLNSWLIALAVAFETRISPYRIWRENFLWLSLNYFSGASVALLLVVYTRDVDLRFIGVIVPLLLVLYFTFKTSMQRVEDTNRHLQQLNRLHISTIETLAMAIDAKDQITHGHIRRVQTLAVRLANHVGVADASLIKAIEAAALLHDMGKLAVPEYILNKPGRLTNAEFERMKAHAAVGADILSAIDFPYPVTPIVRHHHENWDGSGYPQGLSGVDIPIGARILSVVDCFDALTSDRPYRPRLSDEDALVILMERRGSMYDPLIVDTFAKVYRLIAPEVSAVVESEQALSELISSTLPSYTPPSGLEDIAASADEMLTLYELARSLAGQADIADTGDVIAKHLKRLIPFTLCVLYLHDVETNELEARHVIGDGPVGVRGLRMAIGQHLSGWVAANRQSILNSDPLLDFGEAGRSSTPRLRSCLSAPLVFEDQLVGVLSLYSDVLQHFNEDHKRILEAVSRQIAHTFKLAVEFDGAVRQDAISGLPSVLQLEQLLAAGGTDRAASTNSRLLMIEIVDLQALVLKYGRNVGDDVIRHAVKHIRAGLRVADILFRGHNDQFVALINDASEAAISSISRRIHQSLSENSLKLRAADGLRIQVRINCLAIPTDRTQLAEALNAVRTRTTPELANDKASLIH
jgi:diguanylate cyclase (GGDEF)-like protein/putative nucleotidyltransferase with HDIG domain